MALPDTGPLSRWAVDWLRGLFLGREQFDFRSEAPRRKGVVIAVCVLASTLLWFLFAMSETYTRLLDFPTEVRNLAPDEALYELPPRTIRAQVTGEGIQLLRLYYDPPAVPVDAASRIVDLEVVAPEAIQNVRIDVVTPRTVTVSKEPRVMRRLPVRSRIGIVTAPGHHVVGNLTIEPDSVTVSGAGSVLARLKSWPTRATSMEADNDTLDVFVTLSDSLDGLLAVDTDQVRIRASVREFTEASRRVEVRVLGAPVGQRVSLEPAFVDLVFQVPIDSFEDAMASEDLYAVVDYDALRSDTTGAVRPEIHFPPDIDFRAVSNRTRALRYYFDILGME